MQPKKFVLVLAAVVSLQTPVAAGEANTDITAQSAQAQSLLWAGKLKDAAKMYKTLLKSADSLGDNAGAAQVFDDYAWLLQAQDKFADAASYAQKALEMRKRVLPAGAPEIAQSYEHIGEQDELQGAWSEAATAYKEAMALRKGGGDAQAIPLANVTEKLAIVQMKIGNRAESERLFSEAATERSTQAAQFQRYSNPSAWQTSLYRYALGAPHCSRAAVAGESFAVISADGLQVQATVLPAEDFKGTTAFVRIVNEGHGPVDFLPEPPVLLEMQPQFRIAEKLHSDKVAEQIEKKGQHKANMIRFWQGDATTPVTTNVMNSGYSVNQGWGYGMYPNGQWGAYPNQRTRVSPQMTTITENVPDWEARARAEAKAQATTEKANAAADLVRSQKLLATTLQPGQMVEGSALFDATKVKKGILRIPVGNAVFEFPIEGP